MIRHGDAMRTGSLTTLFLFFFCTLKATTPSDSLVWTMIPTPVQSPANNVILLGKDLGYISYTDELTSFIYKYKNGHWTKIPLPENWILDHAFFAGEDDIWIVATKMWAHKQHFLHYRAGRWEKVPSPNVDNIKSIVFQHDGTAWAGCDWGELLRYENGRWQRRKSPTQCHLFSLAHLNTDKLFALTDCQTYGQLFAYFNGSWKEFPQQDKIKEFIEVLYYDSAKKQAWVLARGEGKQYLLLWEPESNTFSTEIFEFGNLGAHQIAVYPDGSGYFLSSADSLWQFTNMNLSEARYLKIDGLANIEVLTISPDGGVWMYSKSNHRLWTLGSHQTAPVKSEKYAYSLEILEVQEPMGLGFFRSARTGIGNVYVVLHETPNRFIPLETPERGLRSKGFLEEPQKLGPLNRPIYDLAVLTADFNNDTFEDIFLTSLYGQCFLFLQSHTGQFVDASSWAGFEYTGERYNMPATADVDLDGDLDLYITSEMDRSRLFINNGYGRFKAAPENGAVVPVGGKTAAFGDFDGDGFPDLCVTTYGAGIHLFRNDGTGSFIDLTPEHPWLDPEVPEKVMAPTFVDYDNDGDLDLFIAKQLDSNVLLQNDGRGHFRDVTAQVGLVDSSLSRGGLFFDRDNDGDLDLFVLNIGHDLYYENIEARTFHQTDFGTIGKRLDNWSFYDVNLKTTGAATTGGIVLDYGQNGTMDIMLGAADYPLRLYKNSGQVENYLQFKLTGIHSNTSAVGASVRLWQEGKEGRPERFLGLRHIESTSGYASHSEKLIHFGVAKDATYRAEIAFPGGEKITLTGLRAGKRYDIKESSGLKGTAAVIGKYLHEQALGYRAWHRYLQVGLLIFGIGFMFHYARKKLWWEKKIFYVISFSVFILFAGIHYCFTFTNNAAYIIVPVSLSFFIAGAEVLMWREWRLHNLPNADRQTLLEKLSAFEHNQHYSYIFTDLLFHMRNLKPEQPIEADISAGLLRDIKIILRSIDSEIRMLIGLQRTLRIRQDYAVSLNKKWRKLIKILRKISNRTQKNKRAPRAETLNNTLMLIESIRDLLREIRDSVQAQERLDLCSFLPRVIEEHSNRDYRIELIQDGDDCCVYIPATELKTILDELFSNAVRAMEHTDQKRITIHVVHEPEVIKLYIRDHGQGIEHENLERIFERGFTSKPRGGFGLYYTRLTLQKYGGDISVFNSTPGEGTTFEMILKRKKTP